MVIITEINTSLLFISIKTHGMSWNSLLYSTCFRVNISGAVHNKRFLGKAMFLSDVQITRHITIKTIKIYNFQLASWHYWMRKAGLHKLTPNPFVRGPHKELK